MSGEAIVLAALGIMATVVGGLVWLLRKLFTQNDTTVKQGNKVNLKLAEAIERMSLAAEEQIKAIKERAIKDQKWQELVILKLDDLAGRADRNYDAVIGTQVVKEQTVQHQVVTSTEAKKK